MTTAMASSRFTVAVRCRAERLDNCWVWGGGTSPSTIDVAVNARSRAVEFTAIAACSETAKVRTSARSVRASAMSVDSEYRCSTASLTSSAEQPQIESWAALRITSSQATSRKAPGQSVAGSHRAASGSATRSSHRSARAAACFTSTRHEATPMSRLVRAPERSSPTQRGRSSRGDAARCVASEVTTNS